MKIRNIKIGFRLSIGFGILIVLAFAIGFIALDNISKATIATERLYNHPLTVSNAVRDIKTNIVSIHRSMKDVALANNEYELNEAKQLVDGYEKSAYSSFDIVFKQFLGDMKDVETAYKSFSDWKPIREEVIQLWLNGEADEAITITKGKGARHVEKVLRDVNVMIDFASNKADEFYNNTKHDEKTAFDSMLIVLFLFLIISILVILVITRSMVLPLKVLNENANEIEQGNLGVRNKIKYKDEVSQLADSFNTMVEAVEAREKILKNLAEISAEMIGKESVAEFANAIIRKLTRLVNAELGVFYILNQRENIFVPIDSIGANTEALRTFSALNPEGELSHVVKRKKLYHLKDLSKKTAFIFKSTLGEIVPSELIAIPILVNNKIMGVIACANVSPFSKQSLELIQRAQVLINTSCTALLANEETQRVAIKLKSTNEELEMQSEELLQQSEELKNNSEKLYEQNAELVEQRKQVEDSNRLKSEFLSNMSHELRTPLNSINALSKVLLLQTANRLDADENEYLRIIERNGKRLLSLINDILDLSKVEAGKMEILPTRFSMNSALKLSRENLKPLADDKGIEIMYEIDEDIMVESDENRFHQVITNVLGNAIKFTEKGYIKIKATAKKQPYQGCL